MEAKHPLAAEQRMAELCHEGPGNGDKDLLLRRLQADAKHKHRTESRRHSTAPFYLVGDVIAVGDLRAL